MTVHLLHRWQAYTNPRSMEAHKEIADTSGSVWWGLLAHSGGTGLMAEKWNDLYGQIATGVPTHVYFVGITGLWRADLVGLTADSKEVDAALVPSYYDQSWLPEIWIRLTNFIHASETEGEARKWTMQHLRLVDSGQPPDYTTQLTLFAVHEISDTDSLLTGVVEATPVLTPTQKRPDFNPDTLAEAVYAKKLRMDRPVINALAAALMAGKHVILTGPPGTGKTTLAEATADHAAATGLCTGHMLTTATSDWTTFETIGGLVPEQKDGSLEFRPGHFLVAARNDRWLIIDELNRSNFDRAFGQLFSVLSGQSVVLPYADPRGRPYAVNAPNTSVRYDPVNHHALDISDQWRIIATMNVFDKTLLFEMSFALMRRFVFIEVPSPSDDTYRELWNRALVNLSPQQRDLVDGVLQGLLTLRKFKDLGPATYMDMSAFAAQLAQDESLDAGTLAFQMFYSFLLPQFEGIDRVTGQELYMTLTQVVGPSLEPRLRTSLEEVLGLTIVPTQAFRPAAVAGGDDRF